MASVNHLNDATTDIGLGARVNRGYPTVPVPPITQRPYLTSGRRTFEFMELAIGLLRLAKIDLRRGLAAKKGFRSGSCRTIGAARLYLHMTRNATNRYAGQRP
jgi:hypothetical protein